MSMLRCLSEEEGQYSKSLKSSILAAEDTHYQNQ